MTASHSNVHASCNEFYHHHGLQHDLAYVMSQGGLRGGGGSSLLPGLKAFLKETIVDTSEQTLYDELCGLVSRKPKNLLQALKALVSKHTREQPWKTHAPRAAPRTVVLQQTQEMQPASQVAAAEEGWQKQ